MPRNLQVEAGYVKCNVPIKIGYASWPIDRFHSMLTGSPVPLSLLASMPGGSHIENKLHKQFAEDRSHGEWFRRSPELDAVIAAAPTQYGPEFRDRVVSLARKEGWLYETRRAQRLAAQEKPQP